MELLIFLAGLFGAIAIGVPIAFGLMIAGILLMVQLDLFDSQLVAENLVSGANSFTLIAIPFFILAGEIMNAGGITQRLIRVGLNLFGHLRGGIGYVVIVAAVLFASLSGSAIADAVALGTILIPLMNKAGYDNGRSCGLVASSGIIAPIIPPSIPMIIYGVTGNISITSLFIAGIVPGFLMGITLMTVWWFVSRHDNFETLPRQDRATIIQGIKEASWALMLPVIIIVGLRFGVFTPTEAGVVAAFYALFVSAVIYRSLSLAKLYDALVATAKLTSVVMFLVAASGIAAWMITMARIPDEAAALLEHFIDNPLLLMVVINVVVLFIGMTMDLAPIIIILTPILLPVIVKAGIDPVYFGVVFILNLCVGLLTPPVGTVLAAICSVGRTSIENVTRGMLPFLLAHIALLALFIIFPQLITYPMELFLGN